jgi:multidrug efflux pump subunit AcrA (membrane-fusion protein)
MSTGLIIAIVVVAVIIIAVLFFIPRMRRKAELRKRERELGQRREAVATEHRETAEARAQEAEQAERQARMAQKEADRQRAEAELHQERAQMHERGDADHELIEEHEREKFAGTSADPDGTMAEEPRGDTAGTGTGTQSEFEQGREVGHQEAGERGLNRDDETSDTPGARRA